MRIRLFIALLAYLLVGTSGGTLAFEPVLGARVAGADGGPRVCPSPWCRLAAMDGRVHYWGDTPATGSELWRSNGGGTTEQVADIVPGRGGSKPAYLEPVDGWLYFQAYTPDTGYELWRSNGTTTTELVADLVPGSDSSFPEGLAAMDGWVYFQAGTPGTGDELWRSNGSTTELVADIERGVNSSYPWHFEAMDGWLYFTATGGLWRSNGADVTELVAAVSIGSGSEAMGGWLYFDYYTKGTGFELWRSNGTDTTELVTDINPGAADSWPSFLAALGNWVYFEPIPPIWAESCGAATGPPPNW